MQDNQLLEKFQVEELEQRFEMGRWIDEYRVGYNDGKTDVAIIFEAR